MLTGTSLWGKWINVYLLKGKSFWEVNIKMQRGSWMWHKMLKLREEAKKFYKIEVGNGCSVSFWYDNWSEKGVLSDLLGDRGFIDLGVSRNATVAEVVQSTHRRRRHRVEGLNDIEREIDEIRSSGGLGKEDIKLWRCDKGYKQVFKTKDTWNLLRSKKSHCSLASGIWFSNATPKYAFMAWLSVLDRLSTMDRVVKWSHGSDVLCVLCKSAPESRSHLFFECDISAQVWEYIANGVLKNEYTTAWSEIIHIISDKRREKKSLYCIRYAVQAVLYALWREKNKIKHGEKMLPINILKKVIEKGIRNRISLICRKGVKDMGDLLQFWFSTRL